MRGDVMLLYHGSNQEVRIPSILYSRIDLDFGQGFYTARDYEQAAKWARRFLRRKMPGIVNIYELDMETVKGKYRVKEFLQYDEEWLYFVIQNRQGKKQNTPYDLIAGGIANDKVFNTVELFVDGLIDEKEALGRLQYQEPNWQICIRNQEILDKYVRFVGCEEV